MLRKKDRILMKADLFKTAYPAVWVGPQDFCYEEVHERKPKVIGVDVLGTRPRVGRMPQNRSQHRLANLRRFYDFLASPPEHRVFGHLIYGEG
ncbi:MAG: hypothetical protein Q27BPR15_17715 [Rhodobacter sp. CACIA14H1]|nr:MAG: hypothetical protein Q27BPR15_17715 [Rhodobacter sp. CACIA14H1]